MFQGIDPKVSEFHDSDVPPGLTVPGGGGFPEELLLNFEIGGEIVFFFCCSKKEPPSPSSPYISRGLSRMNRFL